MNMTCRCTACGERFAADQAHVGHKVTCPHCRATVLAAAPAGPKPASRGAKRPISKPAPQPCAAGASPVGKPSAASQPRKAGPQTGSTQNEEQLPVGDGVDGPSAPRIIVTPQAVAATWTPSASPNPRRTGLRHPAVLAVLGTAVVVLGVAIGLAIYLGSSRGGHAKPSGIAQAQRAASAAEEASLDEIDFSAVRREPTATGSKAGGGVLEVAWPDESRREGAIFVDNNRREVPRSGPVRVEVSAGMHHVVVMRRGYEPIEFRHRFEPGETFRFEPEWKTGLALPEAPQKSSFGPEYTDWLQDFEEAKKLAEAHSKDILVLFTGSDWCRWCKLWAEEVFFQQDFRERVDSGYVLVVVDFPNEEAAKAKVKDPQRNAALAEQFGVDSYPTLVLTDAAGRVYGVQGYVRGGIDATMEQISNWRTIDGQLRVLAAEIREAKQKAVRQDAIISALELLEMTGLARYNGALIEDWLALVEDADEMLMARLWAARFHAAEANPKRAAQACEQLDEWLKVHELRDPDVAAGLRLAAALALQRTGQHEAAKAQCDAGLACKPRGRELRALLEQVRRGDVPREPSPGEDEVAGTGTGFCVAEGGFILTNSHVVADARLLRVKLPDREEPLPAKLLADDAEGDMALIKIELAEGVKLPPIPVTAAEAEPGEEVCALGYPTIGSRDVSLMVTRGIISALADASREGMIATDCKINPGNSGGPMVNVRGMVLGMVTAKSFSDRMTDSFGLITPAPKLHAFLVKHVPDYEQRAGAAWKLSRDLKPQELHRMYAPSVVLIQNVR